QGLEIERGDGYARRAPAVAFAEGGEIVCEEAAAEFGDRNRLIDVIGVREAVVALQLGRAERRGAPAECAAATLTGGVAASGDPTLVESEDSRHEPVKVHRDLDLTLSTAKLTLPGAAVDPQPGTKRLLDLPRRAADDHAARESRFLLDPETEAFQRLL